MPILYVIMCVHVCVLSHFNHVQLFATLWTVAYQALLFMGFSRPEYWSGLPWPSPGHLPKSGIEPTFAAALALQGESLPTEPPGKPIAAAAKSLQSCLTLHDPTDGSPSGSPVPGILQARTLEWVVSSFSNAWKWKVIVKSLNMCILYTIWHITFFT